LLPLCRGKSELANFARQREEKRGRKKEGLFKGKARGADKTGKGKRQRSLRFVHLGGGKRKRKAPSSS